MFSFSTVRGRVSRRLRRVGFVGCRRVKGVFVLDEKTRGAALPRADALSPRGVPLKACLRYYSVYNMPGRCCESHAIRRASIGVYARYLSCACMIVRRSLDLATLLILLVESTAIEWAGESRDRMCGILLF